MNKSIETYGTCVYAYVVRFADGMLGIFNGKIMWVNVDGF